MHTKLICAMAGAAVCLGWMCGCTHTTEPRHSLDPSTEEKLSTSQQGQMTKELARLFGSPLRPKIPGLGKTELPVQATTESELAAGAVIFQRRCAGCHGEAGDGNGPAAEFLHPKPRDYRQGRFKFTSTRIGQKPSRSDLKYVIRHGAKGTSMPAFPFLPEQDVELLIDFVIAISLRGEVERTVTTIVEFEYEEDEEIDTGLFRENLDAIVGNWNAAQDQIVRPTTIDPGPVDLARGKAHFTEYCSKCHGEDGKGQTRWLSETFLAELESLPEAEREQINYDDWGHVAPAADLTAGMLHGGRRPVDIYRRIFTGINGTPMPAFEAVFTQDPDDIWHLVHYVLHVVDNKTSQLGEEGDAESADDESTDATSTGDDPDSSSSAQEAE